MDNYIILLRAVNVAGKNIIKMAELKNHLAKIFPTVRTYIQSGNIIIQSKEGKKSIQKLVFDVIKNHFCLDIEVFVLSDSELYEILANNPFLESYPSNKVFITLLNNIPEPDKFTKLNELKLGAEEYVLKDKHFYFYIPEGMSNTKLSNPFIEKTLNVKATGRNLNTMQKIYSLVNNQ